MEKKVAFILIIGIIVSIFIYNLFLNKEIDYLALGDSLAKANTVQNTKGYSFNDYYIENSNNIKSYNKDYVINNLSTRDLYDIINNNGRYEKEDNTIKYLIKEAEIITISIGYDEINNKQNIKLYLYYLDKVVNEIKKLNNNDIYLLGLHMYNDKISDINKEISNICKKYNINYIDTEKMYIDENVYKGSTILNLKAHQKIGEMLLNM